MTVPLPASTDPPGISQAEFVRFRDFFYRHTGIRFASNKRYFVDRRLAERLARSGARSLREYLHRLRTDPDSTELQQLVNTMTVSESYFCREAYQFDALVDGALDRVLARRARPDLPLRIWVVPSSTGEEAYSIAMYLLERWPRIDQIDVEIVASDIDTHALDRARAGVYSARSTRLVPAIWKRRYFDPRGRNLQICPDLRASVDFRRLNLMDPVGCAAFRGFDIVFCRNLLIYFDQDSRRRAVDALHDAMNPGGLLFLGHSEALTTLTPRFRPLRIDQVQVYEKPRPEVHP